MSASVAGDHHTPSGDAELRIRNGRAGTAAASGGEVLTSDSVWSNDGGGGVGGGEPDNELEKRAKTGWSGWSEWSTCSRSCDGGVAQQLRRCHAPGACRGEPIRYRLCNMQVRDTDSRTGWQFGFGHLVPYYVFESFLYGHDVVKLTHQVFRLKSGIFFTIYYGYFEGTVTDIYTN